VPEIVEADVGVDAFRSLTPKSVTFEHYTIVVLTLLLTPPRAQHAAAVRNRDQRNRLRYADSATLGNTGQPMWADCGSDCVVSDA
jgi:hypothetical protein